MCGRSENIKVGNNEVCIKTRTCYYSEDKIKFEDFGEDSLLIDENTYKNILVCDILYKVLIDPKPLCIRFDKVDGFIRVYDENRLCSWKLGSNLQ